MEESRARNLYEAEFCDCTLYDILSSQTSSQRSTLTVHGTEELSQSVSLVEYGAATITCLLLFLLPRCLRLQLGLHHIRQITHVFLFFLDGLLKSFKVVADKVDLGLVVFGCLRSRLVV